MLCGEHTATSKQAEITFAFRLTQSHCCADHHNAHIRLTATTRKVPQLHRPSLRVRLGYTKPQKPMALIEMLPLDSGVTEVMIYTTIMTWDDLKGYKAEHTLGSIKEGSF
jgi:hypothetical protein